ncbi:MAG: DUF6702 family protein [Bacteroidota bacterium]
MTKLMLLMAMVLHPFYMSVTEMYFNEANQSLEVSMKLNIEDVEEALEAQGTPKLHMATEKEYEETDRYLMTYLDKNFEVKVNGEKKDFQFAGKEYKDDVVWCYLEFMDVTDPQTFSFRHKVLTDLFEAQQNIIHLKVSGQKKSLRFHRGNLEGEWRL